MEQTANNNPSSASAQNAFYQALLRADMGYIVAERYQTGKYATNAACDAAYNRALERLGQTTHSHAVANSGAAQGHEGGFSNEQLRGIGQAVAAQSRGGNVAMARGKNGSTGTGAKDSPLYVVVEETIGGTIFKWAKFLFYFGLATYLSLVVITILIDATGMLKKVSGSQSNEAQPQQQKARFSDVHGCDEAKEELQELVEFLKNPDKFSSLGGKLPKGVLLIGPPGTGKTLLARAVAGEAGVPFFFMSGSEFDEIYVGVGAKRVRELFAAARAKAPAIVFIDELDAIGGKRNDRDAAYVKQTLNQLLTDLDGFSQTSGVIFLAATNFPQSLDKALTRPGRFDRNVVVPLPDVRGRVNILKHHMKSVQVSKDVDAAVIARGTPGFSGAELENVVNQAAVHASRHKLQSVGMHSFEWAKDKIMMGAERRSAVIQQKDKIMTAYHEGGHTLVAMFTEGADPLYKATIMPRGQALGITFQLPELDKVSMMKKEYLARIDICMGGKVAEELVYGADAVTSGAASDLQQATKVAYAMVTQMGMSEDLGNVDFETDYAHLSSSTKQKIEKEVKSIIESGRARAMKLLTTRRKELDTLAQALVEYETLSKDEIEKVLRGEKLPQDKLSAVPDIKLNLPLLPPAWTGARPGEDAGAGPAGAGSGGPTGPGNDGGAKL
ncbi:MAG: Glycerol kinase [Chaenotheca gracillima]|nr:MAG: Glycerol kinase [Chaenotheca gracillima]